MNAAQPAKPASVPPPAGRTLASLRELGIAWERAGGQDVGFGAVVWLRLTPPAAGLSAVAAAAPAVRPAVTQALRIGETGQVPEIEVENRGPSPVLLPSHIVLVGGWQTRAVERSVVIPAGSVARVPVKCVEAGRWAPRDEHTAASFEVADRTAVRTRWSTSRSMADQLTRHGRFAAEQAAVWTHVDEVLAGSPVGSRTRSYEAYLRGVKRPFVEEARKARVAPPAQANGVVILPRAGGFWIEAYPTAGALAEQVDDLIADLFDPASDGERDAGAVDAAALLEGLWAAPLRALDRIPGTAGDTYAVVASERTGDTAGAVLLVDGGLAHASLGAPPASYVSRRRPSPSTGTPVAAHAAGAPTRDARDAAPGAEGGPRGGSGPVPVGGPTHEPVQPARGSVSSGVVKASESSGVQERPRVDLETMRAIYGRARDMLPEPSPPRDRVQGYRLVRVLDRNISWIDVRIGGDGYAVLGSHDRCDLVLPNDSAVWLRHLAAICVRIDGDSVGLRLIDLKTDLPFFLEDDTPRWSVTATGPFAMRLGRHVVCGFPIGPAGDEPRPAQGADPAGHRPGLRADEPRSAPAAFATLATGGEARSSDGDAASQRGGPRPAPAMLELVRAREGGATGVLETGISRGPSSTGGAMGQAAPRPGPLAELSSFIPSAPVSQIQDLIGPSASPDHVRVTLERGGMGASVELPSEALDNGVLLGRALNCFDGGLRRIFCEAISRAHVLLVRDGSEVSAYDLCSTNGTRVGGQRIRRYRLSDAGATLELGKKVVFRWHRRDARG
jgi:hypothetical protein